MFVGELDNIDFIHFVTSRVALYTVYLVIFACLNFRKFLILRIFTKFRIL